MKAVLMSIHPKWCEKIFNREKTIEVRKIAPNLETPFKVYVYQTKHRGKSIVSEALNAVYGGGKVVGEFVCDKIEECIPDYNPVTQEFFYNEWADCSASCLTSKEEAEYGKGKPLYGLHISELKIYDQPKELSEFYKHDNTYDNAFGWVFEDREKKVPIKRPPQSWMYVEKIEE